MASRLSIPALIIAASSLAACSGSDATPGSGTSDVIGKTSEISNGAGPGVEGEIGVDKGADTSDINSDDYFKPVNPPIDWTPEKLEAAMALLPGSCTNPAPSADSETVAVAIAGDCKEVTRGEGRKSIDDLGKLYASQGVDLTDILQTKAASAEEDDVVVAGPEIDLSPLVDAELANLTNDPNSGILTASLRPLTEPKADDDWVGGGRSFFVGSPQFSGTASGFFHVFRRNGVGVYAGADVTGKAFGVQRQLVYANLEAKGLNGKKGEAKAIVRAFGKDLFNRAFTEPEITKSLSLASLNGTRDGTIHFSVGPVPFSVTWSLRLKGSIPVTYSLRPTAAAATLDANVGATVGLMGGADILIAKAGVGGELTIVDTDFAAAGDASIQTRNDALTVCSNATATFNLKNMLGGRLYAYAAVGRPDAKVLNVPLGWKGEMEFVKWEGTDKTFDIVAQKDKCIGAL